MGIADRIHLSGSTFLPQQRFLPIIQQHNNLKNAVSTRPMFDILADFVTGLYEVNFYNCVSTGRSAQSAANRNQKNRFKTPVDVQS